MSAHKKQPKLFAILLYNISIIITLIIKYYANMKIAA